MQHWKKKQSFVSWGTLVISGCFGWKSKISQEGVALVALKNPAPPNLKQKTQTTEVLWKETIILKSGS